MCKSNGTAEQKKMKMKKWIWLNVAALATSAPNGGRGAVVSDWALHGGGCGAAVYPTWLPMHILIPLQIDCAWRVRLRIAISAASICNGHSKCYDRNLLTQRHVARGESLNACHARQSLFTYAPDTCMYCRHSDLSINWIRIALIVRFLSWIVNCISIGSAAMTKWNMHFRLYIDTNLNLQSYKIKAVYILVFVYLIWA